MNWRLSTARMYSGHEGDLGNTSEQYWSHELSGLLPLPRWRPCVEGRKGNYAGLRELPQPAGGGRSQAKGACRSWTLERFRFTCCHLKIMRGGIFLRKMPLGVYVSVKSRIETAVVPWLIFYTIISEVVHYQRVAILKMV